MKIKNNFNVIQFFVSKKEAILSRRCNIVVGTPGRVKQLIERGALIADKVSLVVL